MSAHALAATDSFGLVLRLRGRDRLPLHVRGIVGPATGQRLHVVHDIARTAAGTLPSRGAGMLALEPTTGFLAAPVRAMCRAPMARSVIAGMGPGRVVAPAGRVGTARVTRRRPVNAVPRGNTFVRVHVGPALSAVTADVDIMPAGTSTVAPSLCRKDCECCEQQQQEYALHNSHFHSVEGEARTVSIFGRGRESVCDSAHGAMCLGRRGALSEIRTGGQRKRGDHSGGS